jgi:hypothetical protein
MSEKAAPKRVLVSNEQYKKAVADFERLQDVVQKLYYSAVWHADRPITEPVYGNNEYGDPEPGYREVVIPEAKLWEALRDAAGFQPGHSPEEIPYQGVRFDFSLDRIRILANVIGKRNDFSTEQVNAFLALFREEFEAHVNKAAREFVEGKLV